MRFNDINQLDGSYRQNADEECSSTLCVQVQKGAGVVRGGRSAAYLVYSRGGMGMRCSHTLFPRFSVSWPATTLHACIRSGALVLFFPRYYSSNPNFTLPCLATPVFFFRTLPHSYLHLRLPPTRSYGEEGSKSAVAQGSCLSVYVPALSVCGFLSVPLGSCERVVCTRVCVIKCDYLQDPRDLA